MMPSLDLNFGKKLLTLSLDVDLIDQFKTHHSTSDPYQENINQALREYVN